MAIDSDDPKVLTDAAGASPREIISALKPPTAWVLPLVTAVILASVFCLYYFVYVTAQREYLANRNFRSLAMLGGQIQTLVSIHSSILEFSAHRAENIREGRSEEDLNKYVLVRPEDKSKSESDKNEEALNDYLGYLAPGFEVTKVPITDRLKGRLDAQPRNGRWTLVLTAHRHEQTQKASKSEKGQTHKTAQSKEDQETYKTPKSQRPGGNDYVGFLNFDTALKPMVASLPFDDILLVSRNGSIVYQSNQTGPRFTTLTELLHAQADASATRSKAGEETTGSDSDDKETDSGVISRNADKTWRNRSMHLTDVDLAGTHYKLFLQPVLLDVFNDKDEPGPTGPAQEWVLCGLRSAKALEWEALSISSTFMVWLTILFLSIFMGGPLLKILFINQRQHLRLREIALLAIILVLLTSGFTLAGLNATGFPLNDDTDAQLQKIGGMLSENIHVELSKMREQLLHWCKDPPEKEHDSDLESDLRRVQQKNSKVIRSVNEDESQGVPRPKGRNGEPPPESPPKPITYPYLNNATWTDDDGKQIVKWSTTAYLTPMIDVSGNLLFTHPKTTYLDDTGPAFYFASALPPNRFEYIGVLTMATGDCNPKLDPTLGMAKLGKHEDHSDLTTGAAFLSAQPLSLIDPILPLGYGFALLDDTGKVLFHSDKTKDQRENFLQETDWNKQLQAAMFGRSNQNPLNLRYLGSEYAARVMPVTGVSQSQWSLIVYRDVTAVRTLNLQAMTMTSTLLLIVLAFPVAIIAIWFFLIRRPNFAPEWLWPNQARITTYLYETALLSVLTLWLLFLGFTGSREQNIVACAAVPYTAFALTVWCIWAHGGKRNYGNHSQQIRTPPGTGGDSGGGRAQDTDSHSSGKDKPQARRARPSRSQLTITVVLGAVFVFALWRHSAWKEMHLGGFTYFLCFATIAALPLVDPPRRYVTVRLKRRFGQRNSSEQAPGRGEVGPRVYRSLYISSIILTLFLLGVLVPMALFRASLDIERRLGIKQAQLHLASALDHRLLTINERCAKHELGNEACQEFEKTSLASAETDICPKDKPKDEKHESTADNHEFGSPWKKIILDPLVGEGENLPIHAHSEHPGTELYSSWFRTLIYALHHDYNPYAAEMLGLIPDRLDSVSGIPKVSGTQSVEASAKGKTAEEPEPFSEWSWENPPKCEKQPANLVLYWHGVHRVTGRGPDPSGPEYDLWVSSPIPDSPWSSVLRGVVVAISVIALSGFLVWAVVRRIFLFHVAPLKMTGAMRAAEYLREGRNIVVLLPQVSEWKPEGAEWPPLKVPELATEPNWATNFNLDTLPVNTVIEIRNFEYSSNDPEIDQQKFVLLQRLLERRNTQIAVVMTVSPSPEDFGRQFRGLELVDLREEPFYWLKLYEGPARDLIWKECGPIAPLWPIGAQLAQDIKTEGAHSEETIVSEVLERADGYYRLVWKECSDDQKFVLAQLAEDGLLNPTNGRAIRQLARKGVITTDPQFRLINESFRQFLCSASPLELKQTWLRDSRRSGWGKMHGVFFTTMLLLGVFLLTTQNALWQSAAAYVTTALGALGTLAKLFSNTRFGGTSDKAT